MDPNDTTLNLEPSGKLWRNSLKASTAHLMNDPAIDPLLSMKNMYSHGFGSTIISSSSSPFPYGSTYFKYRSVSMPPKPLKDERNLLRIFGGLKSGIMFTRMACSLCSLNVLKAVGSSILSSLIYRMKSYKILFFSYLISLTLALLLFEDRTETSIS